MILNSKKEGLKIMKEKNIAKLIPIIEKSTIRESKVPMTE